ncbi:MAG: ATP-binding cassette domain-containing protein [Saprospiraceae bacterium]|jgi:ABC-type multidrug transport system ATPase subunit|nr:ATP-binding cassette domain-containing protein [Saprospiraceae bacterium]
MTYAIEINNLSHYFDNKQKVLNKINITVPESSIYGFLGPNGAGKTTSLRLMLGLLQKQDGKINIFGKSFDKNRIEILKQTGSLIEYPSIYGQLSAKQNLLVWQKIYQCPIQSIENVLNIVGLSDTGNKKATDFSLGMKQRLGLAIALLNNPRLLILDEPTNGLDPNGIIEIRDLLIHLNKERGITILISSHLLSEIEKLVTHIGLINKGNMLFEGTYHDLLITNKKTSGVMLQTSQNEKAMSILKNSYEVTMIDNKIQIAAYTDEEIGSIVQCIVQNDIRVYEVQRRDTDLEDIFMNYIN